VSLWSLGFRDLVVGDFTLDVAIGPATASEGLLFPFVGEP
jgi:hypothetical protein